MSWSRLLVKVVGPLFIAYLILDLVASAGVATAVRVVAVFVVIVTGSIVVHEAGHAAMARLVGFRVVRVVSGLGPRLLGTTVGATEVELRLFPAGGLTVVSLRDPDDAGRAVRLRHFLVAAAGPAATLGIALAGSALVPDSWQISWVTPEGALATLSIASVVAVWNWWALITNLVPIGTNDGAILVWLLRSTPEDVVDLADRLGASETAHRAADGDVVGALAASSDVDASTTNTAAVAGRAAALSLAGRWAEARSLLLTTFDREMPAARAALVANNLAWATAHLGDPSMLVEADEQSRFALDHAPHRLAAFLGTRARVLALQGRLDEADELLDEAAGRPDGTAATRAEDLATRALVSLGRGDPVAARRDVDTALRLAPSSPGVSFVLERVDLRSLAVVVQACGVGPDGPAPPGWLWSEPASPTRTGALRALRRGDAVAVEHVLESAGLGGIDRADVAAVLAAPADRTPLA